MAFKLISVLLVFVVVLHEINSQATNLNCGFQIQQFQIELNQAARESRFQVQSTRIAIQSQGSIARFNVKTKIVELENKIQQAAGPNAALCTNQAHRALEQLNLDFNLCYKNIELNQLDMQISQINALKSVTSQICYACAGVNECVNGKIEEVRNQVNGIQAQVTTGLANIPNGSAECFQAAQDAQIQIINNVNKNFDDCL